MEPAAVDNDIIVAGNAVGVVGADVQSAAATDLQRVIGEQRPLVRIVLYAAVLQAVDGSGH